MTWKSPAIVFVTLVIVLVGRESNSQRQVLGQQDTVSTVPAFVEVEPVTPEAVEAVSEKFAAVEPEATPTATPTEEITPIPTPTVKPQPEFAPEQINEFYEKYGSLYAIDPNVLRHVAKCESGFNPKAKNHIYAGLYQFDGATWRTYRTKLGLETDPDLRFHAEEAIRTAAFALSQGAARLWPNCFPD